MEGYLVKKRAEISLRSYKMLFLYLAQGVQFLLGIGVWRATGF